MGGRFPNTPRIQITWKYRLSSLMLDDCYCYDYLVCFRYYLATAKEDPAQRHLYRVEIGSQRRHRSDCLSCKIKNLYDDESYCLYNSAEFSKDSSHYFLSCLGPGIPDISIYNRVRLARIYQSWPYESANGSIEKKKKNIRSYMYI